MHTLKLNQLQKEISKSQKPYLLLTNLIFIALLFSCFIYYFSFS